MPVTIRGSGQVPVQIIQVTKTDVFSASSTYPSWVDVTGMSLTITPTNSANRILLLSAYQLGSSAGNVGAYIQVLRGSTSIFIGDNTEGNAQVTSDLRMPNTFNTAGTGFMFLDSPATTSATTYKLQICTGAGATVYMNRTGSTGVSDLNRSKTPASLIALEIAYA